VRGAAYLLVFFIGCGGRQGGVCGALDACPDGMECIHGGPANLGTCERSCKSDTDCPDGQRCELEPPPDALPNVCIIGSRFSKETARIVSATRAAGSDRFELAGAELEQRRTYALVGATPVAGLVRVLGSSTTDCDHCRQPRYDAEVVKTPSGEAFIAIGPANEPLPAAFAKRFDASIQMGAWSREIAVDVEGDGAFDLERVARCDHESVSGCDKRICDRICRGTRTVGSPKVRAVECQGFVPDLEDCVPRAD
jgi:hypothetical protein